jgi:phosphoribosylaminoimidazole-succinocarboxamide synthase
LINGNFATFAETAPVKNNTFVCKKSGMPFHQNAILETRFQFPNQTAFYRGKVRDVYTIGDQLIVVASDRISAFDHILPRPIPYKGQVLNQTAAHFLEATRDIVPNWLISTPDPNVSIGYVCEPIRLEMVIRAYLSGHAWRLYNSGKREICEVQMPDGMRESDPFPEPIITPATKAEEGHDEDISKSDVLKREIVTESEYEQLEHYTKALFKRGTEMAARRGLILVDTKYEFGKRDGQIYLIDEVHTPDSSRYFYADGYAGRQERGERQQQLSKEFVREWLMEHGFQGLEDQIMPVMSDDFVETVSRRYIELYEKVTGKVFQRNDANNIENRIYNHVITALGDG